MHTTYLPLTVFCRFMYFCCYHHENNKIKTCSTITYEYTDTDTEYIVVSMNSTDITVSVYLCWLRKIKLLGKKIVWSVIPTTVQHFCWLNLFPLSNLVMSSHSHSVNCYITKWKEFQRWQLLIITVTAEQRRQTHADRHTHTRQSICAFTRTHTHTNTKPDDTSFFVVVVV